MDKKERLNSEFERAYVENFAYVYNYIYMKVLHKETAEDLCSKVFMKAYQNWESYDPSMSGERTWFCIIARSMMADYARSAFNRRVQVTDEPPEVAVMDDYSHIDRSVEKEVAKILSILTDEEREIISMRYAVGLQVNEIADMLGISPNAATHRILRILEKCKKFEDESGNKFEDFM